MWLPCVMSRMQNFSLYIDGELKASANDATGAIDGSEALVIGNVNVNFDSPFIGSIDEFTLYNDALTELEIRSKYEHGVNGYRRNSCSGKRRCGCLSQSFQGSFHGNSAAKYGNCQSGNLQSVGCSRLQQRLDRFGRYGRSQRSR